MTWNFELILVVATALTGISVLVGALLRRNRRAAGRPTRDGWWVDFCRSVFPVLLVVFLVRSFVIEPFRIPSGSMLPNLLPGDFILVNKSAFGVRLPVTNQRVFGQSTPERGDLAVFRYPLNPAENYIKRIIGLPGDRILTRGGQLMVNGELVPHSNERLEPVTGAGLLPLSRETLDDRAFDIVMATRESCIRYGVREEFVVPEGQYFTMGDNRSNSADSRCWGPVADEFLVGRAFMVWMSWNGAERSVNWNRLGLWLE